MSTDSKFDARRLMGRIWRNYVISGRCTISDLALKWNTPEAEVRDAIRAARNTTKSVN